MSESDRSSGTIVSRSEYCVLSSFKSLALSGDLTPAITVVFGIFNICADAYDLSTSYVQASIILYETGTHTCFTNSSPMPRFAPVTTHTVLAISLEAYDLAWTTLRLQSVYGDRDQGDLI